MSAGKRVVVSYKFAVPEKEFDAPPVITIAVTNGESLKYVLESAYENLKKQNEILIEALKDITTYDCGSDGFAAPTMESNYKSQKAREALAQIEKMRG